MSFPTNAVDFRNNFPAFCPKCCSWGAYRNGMGVNWGSSGRRNRWGLLLLGENSVWLHPLCPRCAVSPYCALSITCHSEMMLSPGPGRTFLRLPVVRRLAASSVDRGQLLIQEGAQAGIFLGIPVQGGSRHQKLAVRRSRSAAFCLGEGAGLSDPPLSRVASEGAALSGPGRWLASAPFSCDGRLSAVSSYP
ncbi:UNVERIFIED_CONTAM: hypothetical protein K2H54_019889 [Gekko kuhli]